MHCLNTALTWWLLLPRFLPDNSYMTEVIFDQVVQEARDVLNGCNSATRKFGKMKTISASAVKGDPGENIIKRGAALAKHIKELPVNNVRRWEILADFWAEMMLFVTPSNDTTVHAEYLAKGGEFVTHLWALLSHAFATMKGVLFITRLSCLHSFSQRLVAICHTMITCVCVSSLHAQDSSSKI
jgi:hypothetical protein